MILELILKKLIIVVVLCLASLISLYLYFKPTKNYSIAELQQNGRLSNNELKQKQNSNNSDINNNIKSYIQSLTDCIDKAPFRQEDTHAILTRNSENIQKYLSDFSKLVDINIMNNNNLTNDEKSRIL